MLKFCEFLQRIAILRIGFCCKPLWRELSIATHLGKAIREIFLFRHCFLPFDSFDGTAIPVCDYCSLSPSLQPKFIPEFIK